MRAALRLLGRPAVAGGLVGAAVLFVALFGSIVAAIVLLVGGAVLALLCRHRPDLLVIVGLVLAAHGIVTLVLQSRGAGFADDQTYQGLALRMAHGETLVGRDMVLSSPWVFFLSLVYRATGDDLLAGRMLAAVLGVAVAVVCAHLASRRSGRTGWSPTSVYAGLLVGLWPSLMLWSALTLKDTFGVLCIVGTVWAVTLWIRGGSPLWLGVALAAAIAFIPVRPYAAVVLGDLAGLAVMLLRKGAVNRALGVAFAVFFGLACQHFGYELFGWAYVEQFTFGKVSALRAGLEEGGNTRFGRLPHNWTVIYVVPANALTFLLAPFPWAVRSKSEALGLVESAIWWPAFALSVAQLWRWRRRWRLLALPVGFSAVLVGLYAFVEGNLGTAFRHRAQIIPLALVGTAAFMVSAGQKGSVPLFEGPQAEEPGAVIVTAGDVVVEEALPGGAVDDTPLGEADKRIADG
jgi:hypothetical protein